MLLTQKEKLKLRTWVEIDKSAIKYNYNIFKSMLKGDTILMPVVKSNAYGHGLVPFTKELVKLGAKFLGVDSFEEAVELRNAGIKSKILVFGYVSPEYFLDAMKLDVSLTISTMTSLEATKKVKGLKNLKVHIKTETGLGRQGFVEQDMQKVLEFVKENQQNKQIKVEGIYSHLAVGEDTNKEAKRYTKLQVDRLNVWHEEFRNAGYKPLKHICATSSTMFYPEYHFDMVRVGIGMYGLWPSKETKDSMQKKYKLHPVLSWKTIVTETKKMKKGMKVGYDLTEALKRDSTLGIIPVGYWHGYPRALSRRGTFVINNKKVKIVGNVCMDMSIVDCTNTGAKVGDEVTIIGGNSKHYAEADMLAQSADTINYEIVTRINPILKRFYSINPELKRFVV